MEEKTRYDYCFDPMARKDDENYEVDMRIQTLADEKVAGGWNKRNAPTGATEPITTSSTRGAADMCEMEEMEGVEDL